MSAETPHILCVIYGTELYGSERGTLQALCALRDGGAQISVVGSNRKPKGGETGKAVTERGLPLYLLPFGSHLKRSWMVDNREYRKMIFGRIRRCTSRFKRLQHELKPTHIMICGTSPIPFILPALIFSRTKIIYEWEMQATATPLSIIGCGVGSSRGVQALWPSATSSDAKLKKTPVVG